MDCTCAGPWNIGLPFDHPIWEGIVRSCPVHGQYAQHHCSCCAPPTTRTDSTTNTVEIRWVA